MEELLLSIILAIVQGITEWLPISSSGHLVLFEHIFDFHPGLMFDVALHFGTLMAVFVYFGKDIVDIAKDFLSLNFKTENGKTAILLIIATIPAGIVGFFFKDLIEKSFNSLLVTSLGFAITSLFLFISSLDYKNKKSIASKKDSLLIGIAQAFSIIPGISRSGTTISAGILLGLNQKAAARFAFLMAIPIIIGANILTMGNSPLPPSLIWATIVSFISGLAAIHILYKYFLTKKENLRYFAAYALILAIGIMAYLLI